MMKSYLVQITLLITLLLPQGKYKPAKGFVPDENTAIRIAEAVLIPIYGDESQVARQRPFTAKLVSGIWEVRGAPADRFGGNSRVKISKSDGRIVDVLLEK